MAVFAAIETQGNGAARVKRVRRLQQGNYYLGRGHTDRSIYFVYVRLVFEIDCTHTKASWA